MKLATTLLAAMIACSTTAALAQDASLQSRHARAFGLVTETAGGREVPVPAGLQIFFRNLGSHDVYTFQTVRVTDRLPADAGDVRPVTDSKASNYWTKLIPPGNYKVTIRGGGFLPYNAPGKIELAPSSRTRLDFAGLRRRSPVAAASTSVDASSADAESPLAAAPAIPVAGGTGSSAGSSAYLAQFVSWGGLFQSSYPAGSIIWVKFTMKNVGTNAWLVDSVAGPGVVHPKQIGDPKLAMRGWVVAKGYVFPGKSQSWSVKLQLPASKGSYNLQFKMHRDLVSIQDPTPMVKINVD